MAIEATNHFDANDSSYSIAVDQAISTLIEPRDDWYTWEALDSCEDNGYLQCSPLLPHQSIYHSSQPLAVLRESLKSLSTAAITSQTSLTTIALTPPNQETQPHVFLTDGVEYEHAILDIVNHFMLNDKQKLVIHIITDHSIGRSKVGAQLLDIFGEGGIGKSHLIEAIRVWFATLSRSNELVITTTTETTTFNVKGHTL